MDKSIIHVDMDAFYASIEQRDNPRLKNKPIIVGGKPNSRGVVSTASYEARKYGVKSGISSALAKKLCPEAVFVPVNIRKYKEVSKKVRDIFKRYTDIIEILSIDEAFLDVTGKDPINISKNIKEDIKNELELTASVGISYNKFLAKLASDFDKPDGLTIIKKEDAMEFLKPLSIRKLWGVGPKTEHELNRLGIYTIGELQNYDEDVLVKKLGIRGKELIQFSRGIDNRKVEGKIKNQSIGEEETFPFDVGSMSFLYERLEEYSQNISYSLVYNGYLARTVTVKIKYEDFSLETRSITLNIPTDNSDILHKISIYILKNKFNITKKIRLLGLSVSNFIYPEDPVQLSFIP